MSGNRSNATYTLLQLESDFGILQLEKPRLVFFDDMFAFPESRQP